MPFIYLDDSSDREDRVAGNRTVIRDAGGRALRLDDTAVAHIDADMPRVADDISRLHILVTDRLSDRAQEG